MTSALRLLRRVRPREGSLRAWSDGAVSDVLGTAILVGISVVLAAVFSGMMLNIPAPVEAPHAELAISLEKGSAGWGSGDERVHVTHKGGQPLLAETTTVHVTVAGDRSSYAGASLASGFADGVLSIGERWARDFTVDGASEVRVAVVSDLGQGSRLLATATFAASDCSADATAPVVVLAQSPANVSAASSGAVTITATLDDDCAGVDATAAPHLLYRIDDGSDPAYADAGAMTLVGADRWQGTIPDPTWAAQVNLTLQYYASPATDRNANVGSSAVVSDLVEPLAACASDTTGPTAFSSQSPADLTMNATGAVSATVSAGDDCAGVDESHAPTLYYRLDDGAEPTYASAGAMTLTGAAEWQGTIPAQDWLANRGKTLQWYAGTLMDLNGNSATTSVQSDVIENPCSGDTTAPAASLAQSPANVSVSTLTEVTVTATLSDACAGVDGAVAPHLFYRLDGGGDPAYADAGAMTSLGNDAWRGTIPDPTWSLQGGKTLQYYVGPLTDRFGNSGATAVQSDVVDVVDPCAGDATAPTGAFLQSPADLTMNSTGAVTVNLTASDGCAGVDDSVTPYLHYRIDDGSSPAYTNLSAMTPVGPGQWQGIIPAQDWLGARGKTLQYYAGALADVKGNAGDTPVQSDAIDDPCAGDTSRPTASFSQSPASVTTQTSGGVAVTMTLADGCAGVDAGVAPHLFSRVNGTSPPFTDLGEMTALGGNQWQISIPDASWASHGNKTLEYYASPLTDRFGNTGASQLVQDLVDVVVTHTYVNANTVSRGAVTSFNDAKAEDGVEATFAESSTGSALATTTYTANQIVSNLWSTTVTAPQIDASDDAYATDTSAANKLLEVGYVDADDLGTIRSVVLYAEVSILGWTNDAFTMQACLGATCSAASGNLGGSPTDVLIAYNVTALRPGGGAWTAADITSLSNRLSTIKNGPTDGTWRVDHTYVEVKHAPTTYDMSVQLDWTGVPGGAQQDLQLGYRTTGDTFVVQVWNGTAWNARGGTLGATSLAAWSYTLAANEYLSGSPRIRLVDTTPTGATQGQLFLDYARVKTT